MFMIMATGRCMATIFCNKTNRSMVMYMWHKQVNKQNHARKHTTTIYDPLTKIHIIRIIYANIVKVLFPIIILYRDRSNGYIFLMRTPLTK